MTGAFNNQVLHQVYFVHALLLAYVDTQSVQITFEQRNVARFIIKSVGNHTIAKITICIITYQFLVYKTVKFRD